MVDQGQTGDADDPAAIVRGGNEFEISRRKFLHFLPRPRTRSHAVHVRARVSQYFRVFFGFLLYVRVASSERVPYPSISV